MKNTRCFFLLLCVALPLTFGQIQAAYADTPAIDETEQPLNNPAEEARAIALGKQLRCVVCQSESINDSQADMARDMRQLVREKIGYGWSDHDILDFLRQRYGDYILLQPRLRLKTFLLWIAPLFILGLASIAAFLYIRRKPMTGPRQILPKLSALTSSPQIQKPEPQKHEPASFLVPSKAGGKAAAKPDAARPRSTAKKRPALATDDAASRPDSIILASEPALSADLAKNKPPGKKPRSRKPSDLSKPRRPRKKPEN